MKSLYKPLVLLTFLASSLSMAESQTLKINGMTCGGCVATIKKAVCEDMKSSLTKCNVEIGSITVDGDKLDVAAIKNAITTAGYKPVDETAAATPAPTQKPAKKK